MFTGIVQGIAQIYAIKDSDNFRTQIVKLPAEMRKGLEIGASVANNGVCLTVTEIHDDLVSFDLMQETLRITNLGSLKAGDFVNIEARNANGRRNWWTYFIRPRLLHCERFTNYRKRKQSSGLV